MGAVGLPDPVTASPDAMPEDHPALTEGAAPELDEELAAELEARVARDPGDLRSMRALGQVYFQAGMLPEAAGWQQRILDRRPRDVDARLGLALTVVVVAVGEEAVDFTATTTDGDPVSLADLAGTPVWLTFNATWCADCRAEAPDLQWLHEQGGKDIALVAVYLQEDADVVTPFAQRLGLTFPQVPDPEGRIAAAYRVTGVPSHVLIDSDGRVQGVYAGVLDRERMAEALATLE